MANVSAPYKTLLFGFAFSPNLEANLHEVTRLGRFLGARLYLLHIGDRTPEKEARLQALLASIPHEKEAIVVSWQPGDPYGAILAFCENNIIDLLVLGAVQHENMFQFYVGSIARKLTRNVCCSVLLLIKPAIQRVPCKHIVVNGLDAPETPLAIRRSLYAAQVLGARQVTIVEEIRQQEIHVAVEDDESLREANLAKERLKLREDTRVGKVLKKMPKSLRKGINIKTQSIFGKRGYSIGHYAEVVRADLLVMNAPGKLGLMDRIFPHDIEYILSDLPTDLLIVRPSK